MHASAPARSRFPRFGLVALVIVGLVVALYALGRGADDSDSPTGSGTPATTTRTSTGTTAARTTTQRSRAEAGDAADHGDGAGRRVRPDRRRPQARERPDAAGRQSTSTLRSGRFRLVLSNGQARLRVNGRTRAIPPSDGPVGYAISRGGKITGLGPSQRPVCNP